MRDFWVLQSCVNNSYLLIWIILLNADFLNRETVKDEFMKDMKEACDLFYNNSLGFLCGWKFSVFVDLFVFL